MKDMEIHFSLIDSGQEKLTFTSFLSLYSFCEKEVAFWQEKVNDLAPEKSQRRMMPAQFSAATQLMTLVNWAVGREEDIAREGAPWVQQQIKQQYAQINHHLSNIWLYSSRPYTQAFIDCFVSHGKEAAEAFLHYIQHQAAPILNPTSIANLKGYIAAYEFENQNSDLVKRRKGERISLDKVRNEFVEAKDHLFNDVDLIRSQYQILTEEAKKNLDQGLDELKEDRDAQAVALDERVITHQEQMDDLLQASKQQVAALEETYQELLRLKPAAKYWHDAAIKLRWQGGVLAILILIIVFIGLGCGGYFFHLWLSHTKLPIDLNSLQGMLITATILALYAYILRLLSRLIFSSFHLMRDAEEREQLTYLYLALTNDSQVDERSREIVLQALFSRSETGLLTNEHGPTMPGLDIGQILNKSR